MPGKNRGARQSEADSLMQAAWDLQRDLEMEYGVTVQIEVAPQLHLRGRYCIRLEAKGRMKGDKGTPIATYSRVYPNGDVGSLEGQLFSALNRLGCHIGDVRREMAAPVENRWEPVAG